MKTRKTFLGAALLSLLLLGGCDGIPNIDKTDYFKEYKLETKATEAEIQQIRNGLLGSSSELSSVTMRSESYRRDALSESFDTSDITVKILEDSLKPDVLVTETNETTSKQSKTGGVTVKESTKTEKKEWETSNSDYKITFKKETTNGKTKEIASATYAGGPYEAKERKKNAIEGLMRTDTFDYLSCYANKDGSYICVTVSRVIKDVQGVEWGEEVKEYVKETKTQVVSFIDKDFHLTKYYVYAEESTNKDATTGEWYDSVKLTSYDYSSIEYHYGKREYVDIDKLTKQTTSEKVVMMGTSFKCYQASALQMTNGEYLLDAGKDPTESRGGSINGTLAVGGTFTWKTTIPHGAYSNEHQGNEYFGQRFVLAFDKLGEDGSKWHNAFKVDYKADVIKANGHDYRLLFDPENNPYLVNPHYNQDLTASFLATFTGDKIVVNSIVLGGD